MKSIQKQSFARGLSTIMTLYPATARNRVYEIQRVIRNRNAVEAIAGDMRKVGEDIVIASEKFSLDVDPRPKSNQRTISNNEPAID